MSGLWSRAGAPSESRPLPHYPQALLTQSLGSSGKQDALDPRQVSHRWSWEPPEAVLGGEHLRDGRPSSTNRAPTAQAPVRPGRRARAASWVALALEAHSLLPGPGILEKLLPI